MSKTKVNYQQLQHRIDILVGKFGLEKTIEIMDSLSNNTDLKTLDDEKVKLLQTYLISQSIEIFDLEMKDFYTSMVPEYREARMSCYYLLRKYTDISFSSIGKRFKHSKRAVLYHYQKCVDILSIPEYYDTFIKRLQMLENNSINFIAKLD